MICEDSGICCIDKCECQPDCTGKNCGNDGCKEAVEHVLILVCA
jgi:hypothetical protein